MNNAYYQINSPSVVSEVIDGEAVIVNMESGSYYSVDDAGALVWELICLGQSIDAVCALVMESQGTPEADSKSAITNFVEELVKEELVQLKDSEGDSDDSAIAAILEKSGNTQFSSLELKKYTDMEELLLLDPIHDEGEESGESEA